MPSVQELAAMNSSVSMHNPMRLSTSSPQGMESVHPFKINGIIVWSAIPMYVLGVDSGDELTSDPIEELGASFISGLHKLPDELKINVLSFNVLHDHHISFMEMDHMMKQMGLVAVKNFHHYLRTTPEIAELTRDVFYGQNRFYVRAS
jgi:hypothetical protein